MIELEYEKINETMDLEKILHSGECVIIRNSPEIKKFREEILHSLNKKQKDELLNFYDRKTIPSEKTLLTFFDRLKYARNIYYLGTLLYGFIKKCNFKSDIYIDGGISRFVVPVKDYENFSTSYLFENEDFSRKFSGDNVEMFMNGVSNIHRDFNRTHLTEMYNFWIPMHDVESSEVLQIFEKDFFNNLKDMENNDDNYALLSTPETYHLNFGDFVIFHSEQLHVSPKRCIETTRRHSFDFRIATKCTDDNGHYRSNFKNIENFYVKLANDKRYPLFPTKLNNCNAHQAYTLYKENFITLSELLTHYKELPYTEDRYVDLIKIILDSHPKEAAELLDFAVRQTDKYFWVYKFSKLYEYSGDMKNATLWYKKALHLSGSITIPKEEYPIAYATPLKELLKGDIQDKEKQHKSLVIIPKGYCNVIEKALGSLSDMDLIVPLELETHLTYMKKTSIRSIYGDTFSDKHINTIKKFENTSYENIYYFVSSIDIENKAIFEFIRSLQSTNFFRISPIGQFENINDQVQRYQSSINTSYISPLAQINSTVMIGTENYIADKVSIEDYVTIKDRVSIGRCTGISAHVHIYNDCSIGSFSAIGANSVIAGPPHHIDVLTISNKVTFANLKHQSNYTFIGHDVWIGANVTIKANVKIGNGAVIGANSFVNRDIPPYAIAFGVPAKVYSFRFDHKTIKKLNNSQWWDIAHIEQVKFDTDIEKSLKVISKRKKKYEKNSISFN